MEQTSALKYTLPIEFSRCDLRNRRPGSILEHFGGSLICTCLQKLDSPPVLHANNCFGIDSKAAMLTDCRASWVTRARLPSAISYSGLVGPAAVMAAGTIGAGAAASLILAGAWFGYSLMWVIPLILPLFVISVDSASRIGLLNPDKGMFSLIREHVHPGVARLVFANHVPVHLLIGMGQMSVMIAALMSLLAAAGIVWLLTFGGYQRMQKSMTVPMLLMFCGVLIVAISSLQQAGDIIRGFIPRIPPDLPVPARNAPPQQWFDHCDCG